MRNEIPHHYGALWILVAHASVGKHIDVTYYICTRNF
jgi:hypothetical protein